MSNILCEIKKRASALNKTIVLPEGEDSRVVQAAADTVKEGVSKIILLGNEQEIKTNNPGVDLSNVTIIDPVTHADTDKYAQMLFDIRQGKINKKTGLAEYPTVEDARAYILKDYTMYGALMLKADDVDGMVSGACHSTSNTLRPGLQVIKTAPGEKMVSAYFLMIAPEGGHRFCEDGCYIYADSGLNQNPTSEELAYIALSSAKSAEYIAGVEPRIAFISHSTMGSAKHPDVTKVTDAVKIFNHHRVRVTAEHFHDIRRLSCTHFHNQRTATVKIFRCFRRNTTVNIQTVRTTVQRQMGLVVLHFTL